MSQRKVIRVPLYFFNDHAERGLPTPEVVRENQRHVWIDLHDPATPSLLSDAEFYVDPWGPDANWLGGLKASARATIKAIRAAMDAP